MKPLPRWVGWVTLVTGVLTTLASPELAPVLGAKTMQLCTTALFIVSGLAKTVLRDADGDGKPDGFNF